MHGIANTKNVGADFAADGKFFWDFIHAEFTNNLWEHLEFFTCPVTLLLSFLAFRCQLERQCSRPFSGVL